MSDKQIAQKLNLFSHLFMTLGKWWKGEKPEPIRNSIYMGDIVLPEYVSPFTAPRQTVEHVDSVLKIGLGQFNRAYQMGIKPQGTLLSGLKACGFNRGEILYSLDRARDVYNQMF